MSHTRKRAPNFISYRIRWKHIHHLRKREAFFQDLFGCHGSLLQNEEVCTARGDTEKNTWLPHEVCVKSRDGWWGDAGDLFVSPDFGIWQLPSSLTLAAHVLRYRFGAALSLLPQGPQAATSGAKFQPGVRFAKSGVSPFENKTSKENRVISRKCLFRENMTLSML